MHQKSSSFEIQKQIQEVREYLMAQSLKKSGNFDINRVKNTADITDKLKKGIVISDIEEKSYCAHAPQLVAVNDLKDEQFQRLKSIYGDATVKISVIDGNFAKWLSYAPSDETILAAGGACAIESRDTKVIQFLQQQPNAESNIRTYIHELLQSSPSWTQITGALIPSVQTGVFYDETFPWFLRIAEYGLKDAKVLTQGVYDSIYSGVCRYAKLYAPTNTVLKISFTDLDLVKSGKFDEWFQMTKPYIEKMEKQYALPHEEINYSSFLKSWVEYTYSGPRILDVVKKIISKKYGDVYHQTNIGNATLHVRGKQIDHLDTERMNGWMHAVILGNINKKILRDRKTSLFTPFHRQTIAIYEWVRDHQADYPVGFAGFLDHVHRGSISHEYVPVGRATLRRAADTGSFSGVLNSPIRLHAGNVSEVIKLLSQFKNPNVISFSKDLLQSIVNLKDQIQKNRKKTSRLKKFIKEMRSLSKNIEYSIREDSPTNKSQKLFSIIDAEMIVSRYKADWYINEFIKQEGLEVDSRELIKIAIEQTSTSQVFDQDSVSDELIKKFKLIFSERLETDSKDYETDCKLLEKQLLLLRQEHKRALKTVVHKIAEQQHDNHLIKHVDVLPLGKNVFVSYMQQLLFIPVIQDALCEMVEIEKNPKYVLEEKERLIIDVICQVFPHVESAIRYILIGGDYPWKMRFEEQYESII